MPPDQWAEFQENPHDFMIKCDDETAAKIWVAMAKRGAVKSPPIWEDVAVAICCGAHCDAANHAPDHDMDTEHYCQQYGCESQENYKSANAVLALLAAAR